MRSSLVGQESKSPMVRGTALLALLCGFVFACSLCACAPQQDAAPKAPDDADPVTVAWSAETDCATCHETEAASQTDPLCAASQHGDVTCITCHDDESTLATVHEKATSDSKKPSRLKKTSVDEALCLSCHNSYDELAAKTADFTELVDKNGTSVNPHALPEAGDHTSITCEDCHKMHAETPIAETAHDECISCHHQDVFECYTCHT